MATPGRAGIEKTPYINIHVAVCPSREIQVGNSREHTNQRETQSFDVQSKCTCLAERNCHKILCWVTARAQQTPSELATGHMQPSRPRKGKDSVAARRQAPPLAWASAGLPCPFYTKPNGRFRVRAPPLAWAAAGLNPPSGAKPSKRCRVRIRRVAPGRRCVRRCRAPIPKTQGCMGHPR